MFAAGWLFLRCAVFLFCARIVLKSIIHSRLTERVITTLGQNQELTLPQDGRVLNRKGVSDGAI